MAEHSILFLSAISQVHNGAGTGIGLIDNPIMRERTTQFPIIQSSSIKGVLRDVYDKKINDPAAPDWKEKVKAVFGPEPGSGSDFAGAVSFGDGEIFAFPVRSFKGCFVWASSPLVIHRLYRKLEIACKLSGDLKTKFDILLPEIQSSLARVTICPSGASLLLVGANSAAPQPDNRRIILEEFPKEFKAEPKLEDFVEQISAHIFTAADNVFLKSEFKKKFVVLPEDSFRYFVINATDVVPNIRIGDKGTTEEGSLRYTEYLPAETILYSIVSFEKARHPKSADFQLDNHNKVAQFFKNNKPDPFIIQVGGDETIGKGIVQLAMF